MRNDENSQRNEQNLSRIQEETNGTHHDLFQSRKPNLSQTRQESAV
jgi:hypothetical protein